MVPGLREEAGNVFRHKVDYLCSPEFPGLYGDTSNAEDICKAIRIIHEDLPDDTWSCFYLVQHVFQARAAFLSNEKFKAFLNKYEAFGNAFIDEIAWDSKTWEWRRTNRYGSGCNRGRGRDKRYSGR